LGGAAFFLPSTTNNIIDLIHQHHQHHQRRSEASSNSILVTALIVGSLYQCVAEHRSLSTVHSIARVSAGLASG
jgi:hypothetical protein